MNRVSRGVVKWTPDMDRELVNLMNYGVHKNEVAERLGTTIAAAESRYHRLKKGQVK